MRTGAENRSGVGSSAVTNRSGAQRTASIIESDCAGRSRRHRGSKGNRRTIYRWIGGGGQCHRSSGAVHSLSQRRRDRGAEVSIPAVNRTDRMRTGAEGGERLLHPKRSLGAPERRHKSPLVEPVTPAQTKPPERDFPKNDNPDQSSRAQTCGRPASLYCEAAESHRAGGFGLSSGDVHPAEVGLS